MKKSPFAKVMEDIDNELMALLGSHIHKRAFEEKELRGYLNKTIGAIEQGYNEELIQGHQIQTCILALVNNMAIAYQKDEPFKLDKVFDKDCFIYQKYLNDYVSSLKGRNTDKWKDFEVRYSNIDSLSYPQEFKAFLMELADMIPDSKKSKINDKKIFKEIIDEVISDEKGEGIQLISTIINRNENNIKDIFYKAFIEKMNDSKELKEAYAKEIDRVVKGSDNRARSVVQIKNDEKKDYSYFAIYHQIQSEKKLTIEESVRKINDISKGAVSKYKNYNYRDEDGKTIRIKDIIGLSKPLENFEDRLNQAKMSASISKSRSDIASKDDMPHKQWVLKVLEEEKAKAINRNNSDIAKTYVARMYDDMIASANSLPKLSIDNIVFADLSDKRVLDNAIEFTKELSDEELDKVLNRFDKVPDVFINEAGKDLKENIYALKARCKQKMQEIER